jgi:hypothetical protein
LIVPTKKLNFLKKNYFLQTEELFTPLASWAM